jgi:methionyl-tRNA formyltransferase
MKDVAPMTSELTTKELAALTAAFGEDRIFDLLAKIKDGTITPEERAEFDELTKEARELDPNVLKG